MREKTLDAIFCLASTWFSSSFLNMYQELYLCVMKLVMMILRFHPHWWYEIHQGKYLLSIPPL